MMDDQWRKRLNVVVVVGLAFAAFFIGTRQQEADVAANRSAPTTVEENAAVAKSYRDLMESPYRGPDALNLSKASQVKRPPGDDEKWTVDQALEHRANRRAFAGAPPTVPHKIDQQSPKSCSSCHDSGVVVRGRIAPQPSHAYQSQCTQCHVADSAPLDFGELAELGPTPDLLEEPLAGVRAFPTAPPTIPHSTWMRSNCSSCHGAGGLAPMRTSHPERVSCTQCHAPSAALDQRADIVGWNVGYE